MMYFTSSFKNLGFDGVWTMEHSSHQFDNTYHHILVEPTYDWTQEATMEVPNL